MLVTSNFPQNQNLSSNIDTTNVLSQRIVMFHYNSKTYDIPVVPLGGMLIITAYSMHSVHWRCDSPDSSNWGWDYFDIYNPHDMGITNVTYNSNVITVTFSSIPWGGIEVIKFT